MLVMTERDFLQLDQAARGGVSGTLAEWPLLQAALARCGMKMPTTARAREMQRASAECLDRSEWGLAA